MGEFYAVVPAGGSGTRLWPLSRSDAPKYLHSFGPVEESLLEQTVARVNPLAGLARTYVVCGGGQAAAIARELPELPTDNLLVEPSARNSAPAIGLAAAVIHAADPDAVMGSFAADHLVADVAAYRAAVTTAIEVAGTGRLVTIGITPTRPETGYGYIDAGDALGVGDARAVRSFVEKPSLEVAEQYLAAGSHLWNAGMFVWRCADILAQLDARLPELAAGLREIGALWHTDRTAAKDLLAQRWDTFPSISIDHAVMEGAAADGQVATVPADIGWSDVGDWATVADLVDAGEASSDVVMLGAEGSVAIPSPGRVVTVIGVPDVVVVDTADAVLVVARSQVQAVKQAVDEWRARGRTQLL